MIARLRSPSARERSPAAAPSGDEGVLAGLRAQSAPQWEGAAGMGLAGRSGGIRPSPDRTTWLSNYPAQPRRTAKAPAMRYRQPAVVRRVATGPVPRACEDGGEICLPIEFQTDQATPGPGTTKLLDSLGRVLSNPELRNFRFRIEGHTDTVGSAEHNRALSARRAQMVADYLRDMFGVDQSRLEVVGHGFDMPVVPTPPETPEARNRRVQIVRIPS